ncbi:hypothetical protein ACOME3_010340 [Neoechinorhynchus agilis]
MRRPVNSPKILSNCVVWLASCYINLRLSSYIEGLKSVNSVVVSGDWLDGAKCDCNGAYEDAVEIYERHICELLTNKAELGNFAGKKTLLEFLNMRIAKCMLNLDDNYAHYYQWLSEIEDIDQDNQIETPASPYNMSVLNVLTSFSERQFEELRGTLTAMKTDSNDTDEYIRNFCTRDSKYFNDQLEALVCVKLIESASFRRYDSKCLEIASEIIDSSICVDSIDPLGPNRFYILDQIVNARKQGVLLSSINSYKLHRSIHRIDLMNFANRFAKNETSRYCEQIAHLARHHRNYRLASHKADASSFENLKFIFNGYEQSVDTNKLLNTDGSLNGSRMRWIVKQIRPNLLFSHIFNELASLQSIQVELREIIGNLNLTRIDRSVKEDLSDELANKLSGLQYCLIADDWKSHHRLAQFCLNLMTNPKTLELSGRHNQETFALMAITHLKESLRRDGDTYDCLHVLSLLDSYPRLVNDVFCTECTFPPHLWLRVLPQLAHRYAAHNCCQSEMVFVTQVLNSLANQCPWSIVYSVLRENVNDSRHLCMFPENLLSKTKAFIDHIKSMADPKTSIWMSKLRELYHLQTELRSSLSKDAKKGIIKKLMRFYNLKKNLDDIITMGVSYVENEKDLDEVVEILQTFLTSEGLKIEQDKQLRYVSLFKLNQRLAELTDFGVAVPTCLNVSSPKELRMVSFIDDEIEIYKSLSRPKKFVFHLTDGSIAEYVLKSSPGLELEQRIMQMLAYGNHALSKLNRTHRDIHHPLYTSRTYDICLIGRDYGFVEVVKGCQALLELHLNYQERKKLSNIKNHLLKVDRKDTSSIDSKRHALLTSIERTPCDMISHKLYFGRSDGSASTWLGAVMRFTRSSAVMSMFGMLLGLGDRHLNNILCDFKTGETVHIDFNVCFDSGLGLDNPETVPFRLTQNIVYAFGPHGLDGNFRQDCQNVISALRHSSNGLFTLMQMCFEDSYKIISNHIFKEEIVSDDIPFDRLSTLRLNNRYTRLLEKMDEVLEVVQSALNETCKSMSACVEARMVIERCNEEVKTLEGIRLYLVSAIRSDQHDIHTLKRRHNLAKGLSIKKAVILGELTHLVADVNKSVARVDSAYCAIRTSHNLVPKLTAERLEQLSINPISLPLSIDNDLQSLIAKDAQLCTQLQSFFPNVERENRHMLNTTVKLADFLQCVPKCPSDYTGFASIATHLDSLMFCFEQTSLPPSLPVEFDGVSKILNHYRHTCLAYSRSVSALQSISTQTVALPSDVKEALLSIERRSLSGSWPPNELRDLQWEIALEQYVDVMTKVIEEWRINDHKLDKIAFDIFERCLKVIEGLKQLLDSSTISDVVMADFEVQNWSGELRVIEKERNRISESLYRTNGSASYCSSTQISFQLKKDCELLDKRMGALLTSKVPEMMFVFDKITTIQSMITDIIELAQNSFIQEIPFDFDVQRPTIADNLTVKIHGTKTLAFIEQKLIIAKIEALTSALRMNFEHGDEWNTYNWRLKRLLVDCLNYIRIGYPSLSYSIHEIIAGDKMRLPSFTPRTSEVARNVVTTIMDLSCKRKCSLAWMCGADACEKGNPLRFEPITQAEVDAVFAMNKFEKVINHHASVRRRFEEAIGELKRNEYRLEQKLRWISGSSRIHANLDSFVLQRNERSKIIDSFIKADEQMNRFFKDLIWLTSNRKIVDSSSAKYSFQGYTRTIAEIERKLRDLSIKVNCKDYLVSKCERNFIALIGESSVPDNFTEASIDRFIRQVHDSLSSLRAQITFSRKRIDRVKCRDRLTLKENLINSYKLFMDTFEPFMNYAKILIRMGERNEQLHSLVSAYDGHVAKIEEMCLWVKGIGDSEEFDLSLGEFSQSVKQFKMIDFRCTIDGNRSLEKKASLHLLLDSLRTRLVGSKYNGDDSVVDQVDDAIETATNIDNLSMLYEGWMAWV